MNQIIIKPHEYSPDSSSIISLQEGAEDRCQHLIKILGVKEGDLIKVCLINRGLGHAVIKKLNEKRCDLEIQSFEKTFSSKNNLHLLVGLSRPQTIKKILEHGACMGVSSFHFFPTILSEKSYAQSKIFEQSHYEKYLYLGLAQSSNYYKNPKVFLYDVKSFKQFIDQLSLFDGPKFFLDPKAKNFLKPQEQSHLHLDKDIYFSLGGERGWVEDEREVFQKALFRPIKISEAILRVEMSVFYILSQWELLRNLKK